MHRIPRYSIALIGLVAGSLLGIRAAGAASGDENQFVAKINSARSSKGLSKLAWSSSLAGVARNHSNEMANQEDLHHNTNLPNEVSGWQMLGENVGYGGGVDDLHQAFMSSTEHRENILESGYTLVGIGTVWRNGTLWVTEVFERPMHSSSAPSPKTKNTVKKKTKKVQAPAKTPAPARASRPAAKATVPVAKPPAATNPVGDLTRIMVESLLSHEDPAATSVSAPGFFLDAASTEDGINVVSLSFRPFAKMVGRVNRGILERATRR